MLMFGLGLFFFKVNAIQKLQRGRDIYHDLKFRNVQFSILISAINIPEHEEDRGK